MFSGQYFKGKGVDHISKIGAAIINDKYNLFQNPIQCTLYVI